MNDINLYSLSNYYSLGQLKGHKRFKKQILNEIDITPFQKTQDISKCDWGVPRDKERIYGKTFLNLINPYLKNLSKLINATEFNLQNYWFQQYEKGSKHDWHIHPNLNYTGVYYLEYPDLKVKTELYDFVTKSIINIKKIKEGDVLIFPSNIIHRAPEVKDNKRKTIISFNMDFTMFDFKKINNTIAKKKG